MPKKAELPITKDKKSGKWILHIGAKLSKTGKRSRLRFNTKNEAEAYRKNLTLTLGSPRLKEFDDNLLESANFYNEAFQFYGYKGLADACCEWLKELERRNHSQTLSQLIKEYKEARGSDWSEGYLQTFRWAKKQIILLGSRPLTELDAQYWQAWLPEWRKGGNYSARSFNHLRTFLTSLYSMPQAVVAFPANPMKSIPAAKIVRKEVSISSNADLKALLRHVWEEDPEMIPWFAIAFFAGLRPDSELARLDWADINFKEKWIRIGFGNKTDTKRFIDLADNLALWLKPFAKKTGSIKQTNHRKRKDQLVKDILQWERDISRHTYGSNLEAQARAEGKDARHIVIANMGHTNAQTYNQHYRNARTAKQAQKFWAIIPLS